MTKHLTNSRFEAAWSGDTHEIIKLTLTKWHKDEQPLLSYMCDSRGFSPFSVAVLRGNLKAASTILRIVSKQYNSAKTKGLTGKRWDGRHDDQHPINCAGIKGCTPLQILSFHCEAFLFETKEARTKKEQRGIKNSRTCLLDHATIQNDIPLLTFLVNLIQSIFPKSQSDKSGTNSCLESALSLAVRLGHLRCLSMLLMVVKNRHDFIVQDPGYYVGLPRSVKRRKYRKTTCTQYSQVKRKFTESPILLAAFEGNLASVRWLLNNESDAASDHYGKVPRCDMILEKQSQADRSIQLLKPFIEWISLDSKFVRVSLSSIISTNERYKETYYSTVPYCQKPPTNLSNWSDIWQPLHHVG
jgi:hypothetical protein